MKRSLNHILITVALLPIVLVFCSCRKKADSEEQSSKQQVEKSNIQVTVVAKPDTSKSNSFYCTNRPPLSANPLVKLPLGSIHPGGWLKHQIELMAEGMTGHLTELSRFLTDDNGWFGTEKDGWALRREGDGTIPPIMTGKRKQPDDATLLKKLVKESLFNAPPVNAPPVRFHLSPTSEGYPDVDTYRDLEFYLEVHPDKNQGEN